MLERVLKTGFPVYNFDQLQIVIDATLIEPRGKMSKKTVTLSDTVQKDGEFLALFLHELAHFMDIYIHVSENGVDPSQNFYRISWKSETIKKAEAGKNAFVSGYAASNQYEDFAESFVFYILHNTTFAERAKNNTFLQKKYLYFQNRIF
jgi:hypothetical protein